jgi:ribosomal protein S4E
MFSWKINKISAKEGLITHAHYEVSANDGTNTAKVAGNHYFSDKTIKKPFAEVKEADIVEWIQQETTENGENVIFKDLERQLEALKEESVSLPWLPKTFTLRI